MATKMGVVKVSPDIHKRLKVAAAKAGRSMSELASEALVAWLSKTKTAA